MSARDTEDRAEDRTVAGAPEEEGGFLGRWSRRKRAAAAGTPLPDSASVPAASPEPLAATLPDEPLPDPALLTINDDFTPFLKARVAPELKKAAMKKLFSDPGFNEIDGLDVYLDDFNLIPDLPAADLAMLRHAKEVLWPGRSAQADEDEAPPPAGTAEEPVQLARNAQPAEEANGIATDTGQLEAPGEAAQGEPAAASALPGTPAPD